MEPLIAAIADVFVTVVIMAVALNIVLRKDS